MVRELASLIGCETTDPAAVPLLDREGRPRDAAAQDHERALPFLARYRGANPTASLAQWLAEDAARVLTSRRTAEATTPAEPAEASAVDTGRTGTPVGAIGAALDPAEALGRIAELETAKQAAEALKSERWSKTGGLAPLTKRAAADLFREFPHVLPEAVAEVHAAAVAALEDLAAARWRWPQDRRDAFVLDVMRALLCDLTTAEAAERATIAPDELPPMPARPDVAPPVLEASARARLVEALADGLEARIGIAELPARRGDSGLQAGRWVTFGGVGGMTGPAPISLAGEPVTGRDVEAPIGGDAADPEEIAEAAGLVAADDVGPDGRAAARRLALEATRQAARERVAAPARGAWWFRPEHASRLQLAALPTRDELAVALSMVGKLDRAVWRLPAADRVAAVTETIVARREEYRRKSRERSGDAGVGARNACGGVSAGRAKRCAGAVSLRSGRTPSTPPSTGSGPWSRPCSPVAARRRCAPGTPGCCLIAVAARGVLAAGR